MSQLTIPEAAAELRCSERTVRRAIKAGTLAATFFGGRWLIDSASMPTSIRREPVAPPRPVARQRTGAMAEALREMETS